MHHWHCVCYIIEKRLFSCTTDHYGQGTKKEPAPPKEKNNLCKKILKYYLSYGVERLFFE